MTTDDIKARTKAEIAKVLDAKVEALWQLGEPNLKTEMPVYAEIPVITDIELGVAQEAVEAIAEKYGINQHELYMFRRAQMMELYHGMTRGSPARVELSFDIDGNITWQ